jgi:GNAT superfamily N-acetyltransferase
VPRAAAGLRIEAVPAAATYGLRRKVLRDARPDAPVAFPEDDRPGAFHLGVLGGGRLVAVGSFSPEPTPLRPGRRAVRVRGMAVDTEYQGRGIGRILLEEAVARLRAQGVEVLWGNARDAALPFYRRFGMEVVGDGFVVPELGIPHHVVVMDLTPN